MIHVFIYLYNFKYITVFNFIVDYTTSYKSKLKILQARQKKRKKECSNPYSNYRPAGQKKRI